MSEWGHSFRPAYFRLGHILRAVLRPRAVLALTATATRSTQAAISQVRDAGGSPPLARGAAQHMRTPALAGWGARPGRECQGPPLAAAGVLPVLAVRCTRPQDGFDGPAGSLHYHWSVCCVCCRFWCAGVHATSVCISSASWLCAHPAPASFWLQVLGIPPAAIICELPLRDNIRLQVRGRSHPSYVLDELLTRQPGARRPHACVD